MTNSSTDDYLAATTPQSLGECLQLLTQPLARDHILVKGDENRNQVSVGDVFTGVGTECPSEARSRVALAVAHTAEYIDEISSRNANALGTGLVRALLNVQTETDEEGVPLEEDENKICDIIGQCLLQIQAKSRDSRAVTNLSNSILSNSEVLMYAKYKYLKSVRSGVVALDTTNGPPTEPALPVSQTSIVQSHTQQALAVIRRNYSASVCKSVDGQLERVLNEPDLLWVNQVLVNELIESAIVVSKSTKDLDVLEAPIITLLKFLKTHNDGEVVKALLRVLLVDRLILIQLVEDEDTVKLLRVVMKRLKDDSSLPIEVRDVIASIHNCIDVTQLMSPIVSFN